MSDTMTIDEAVTLLQHVVDRPDDIENARIDMRDVERAWGILKDAVAAMLNIVAPITAAGWLVDSIAEVLANGGNVNDEREAALDVAEMLVQARTRVFDALGLTQRHLVKGSAITEERTVWIDA